MPVVNFHHYKDPQNPASRAKLLEKFGDNWVYVGRQNKGYGFEHSALANPFVSDPRSRGIVVDDPIGAFKKYLWEKIKAKDRKVMAALALIGPDTGIVCWCDPRPCHAHIVEKAAAWLWQQTVATPVEPAEALPTLALSIQQPWAWLIIRPDIDMAERAAAYASGLIKDIENRTWATTIRGRVFVHVGKTIDESAYPFLDQAFPHIVVPRPADLPTGGVVGSVAITDCVRESQSRWFFGPVGYPLADARPLPFKALPGKLRFFHCEY